GTPCVPQAGVCDCQGLPANQRMDQQFSTRYLNPNPLSARCSHTSSQRLERVTNQVNEMVQIVDDTLSKTGLNRVDLLGWAVGGPVVGKYLGDNTSYSGESMSTRQGKVERAIFLSSTFGGGAEQASPTWPIGLLDKTEMATNFNTANTCLSGDGCQAQCKVSGTDCISCIGGSQGCPTSEAGSCDPD